MGDSEFSKGQANARDYIICKIIGMQNNMGHNEKDKGYKALQDLLNDIESDCGAMMQPYKC